MLILKAVSLRPLHGYGVLQRIQQISKDALQIPQGSLYPALYRLEHKGWIQSEWGESENKRKAKFYTLTASGRKQLRSETAEWSKLSGTIATILNATPEDEMQTEMTSHMEAYIEDLVARGIPAAEAQRQARVEFGAVHEIKEECRESVGLRWPFELARDLRYAARIQIGRASCRER